MPAHLKPNKKPMSTSPGKTPAKAVGRLIIFTQDIIKYFGCKDRTARSLLREVKLKLKKGDKYKPTIMEFCDHHTIDLALMLDVIAD